VNFSPEGARRVAGQLAKVRDGLPGLTQAVWVPGRIELVGKHVDYAGGESLVVAVERGIVLGMAPRAESGVRILDLDRGEEWRWRDQDRADPSEPPGPSEPPRLRTARGWGRYPETLVRRLEADFPGVLATGGVTLAFTNSLPTASGMSSSSAFLVALWMGLAARYGEALTGWGEAEDPCALAAYLAAVESGRPFERPDRGTRPQAPDGGTTEGGSTDGATTTGGGGTTAGVGTEGGAQDHAAILCSAPGSILHLSYRPLEMRGRVELPKGWTFVVGVSGVRAAKATGAKDRFNALSREAEQLAATWRAETGRTEPHLGAIVAARETVPAHTLESLRANPRFQQFESEVTEVIPTMLSALSTWDPEARRAFGGAVAKSWDHANTVLKNQVRETRILVDEALRIGATAASGFGAGFGGAVWALVETRHATAFAERWQQGYLRRASHRKREALFMESPTGPGACLIDAPGLETHGADALGMRVLELDESSLFRDL
jgi:galactokinase